MSVAPPDDQAMHIQVGPGLWVDLEGGTIVRDGATFLLTAREFQVLASLVHAMRHSRGYLSAAALASRVGRSEAADPEHCIEQAVSTLRRKLGDVPRRPTLLVGRRGFGYRLCPQTTQRQRGLPHGV
jgi:DNA-binding response OmpR family regulator